MSLDNLIRLGQIESGEFLDFINDSASFYKSSDPSGLATEGFVGTVSGDINTYITDLTGDLHTTGQTLTAEYSAHQGFPTGASGQLQFAQEDGSFGAAKNLFYDYDTEKLGIGGFGGSTAGTSALGLPHQALHISGGNIGVEGGHLDVTGDIRQSGISLYDYTESASGNLHAAIFFRISNLCR